MFNLILRTLILSTIIFTIGCSTNSPKIWFESTDNLISKGNFKKALSQLEIEGKKNTALYSRISKRDNSNAKSKINQIEKELSNQNWGLANELLSNLIENHTWKKTFPLLKDSIKRLSDEERRIIQTNIKLAQASLLQSKLAQYDFNIRSQNEDHGWSFSKSILSNEKNQLAKALYNLSVQALSVQDYANAQSTYSQALQLNSELQKFELSKTINAGLNKSNHKTILSQQQSLLTKLDTALAEEDYQSIITLQTILSNAPFKGREVSAAINRSSAIRLKQAKLLEKQADSVYRHGDVSKAIALWKQAKHLVPSLSSIQEKLARATKVQSKLIQLRKSSELQSKN